VHDPQDGNSVNTQLESPTIVINRHGVSHTAALDSQLSFSTHGIGCTLLSYLMMVTEHGRESGRFRNRNINSVAVSHRLSTTFIKRASKSNTLFQCLHPLILFFPSQQL
jgi:hypothetical protein